jgi:hypothetical protein
MFEINVFRTVNHIRNDDIVLVRDEAIERGRVKWQHRHDHGISFVHLVTLHRLMVLLILSMFVISHHPPRTFTR